MILAVKLWRGVFLASLVAVLALTLLPSVGEQALPGQDKFYHGLTFMLLFLIGVRAFPGAGLRWGLLLGLMGYGVAIELLQGLTGYRSMELLDAVADLVGLVIGTLWNLRRPKDPGCCG